MPTKVRLVKAMVFSSGHVRLSVLHHKESWALKNWCFWTVVLEKILESALDSKEIQPVHAKGDQSCIFIERTDAEAETLNTLATWCEELTHLKRPWCWERLKAGGEGDDREWDDWMASLSLWTWVWVSSRSRWWTGDAWHAAGLGVAKSQTWLSDWTELNWRRNMAKNQRVHPLKPAMAGFIHSRL